MCLRAFLQELAVCTRGHTATPVVRWPPGRSCDPHFTQPARLLLQPQVGIVHPGQQHQLGLHTVSAYWTLDKILTVRGKLPFILVHPHSFIVVLDALTSCPLSLKLVPFWKKKNPSTFENKFHCKQTASSIKQPSKTAAL